MSASLPFAHQTFCYTGIKFDYRSELQEKVLQLGGENREELSEQVSYLISRTTTSEKYKFAAQKKIPILSPEFIELANRDYKKKDFKFSSLKRRTSFFPLIKQTFRFHGFPPERSMVLKRIVLSLGGRVLTGEEKADFVVVNKFSTEENGGYTTLGNKVVGSNWLDSTALRRSYIFKKCDLDVTEERVPRIEDKRGIFENCVFKFSEAFSYQQVNDLIGQIEELGGYLAVDNSTEFTHFLFQGSDPSESEMKEILPIRSKHHKIVSINWLYGCINHHRKLSEETFEFIYSEKTLSKYPTQSTKKLMMSLLDKDRKFWDSFLKLESAERVKKNLFLGLSFSFIGLSDKVVMKHTKLVQSLGGKMVSSENMTSSNVFVLPFGLQPNPDFLNRIERHHAALVTLSWLEICAEDLKLHNPTSNSLFSPYKKPKTIPGLSSWLFSLTGFKQARKMNLGHLLREMGARVKDGFSSKITHLVCNSYEGEKYQNAKKLNIPVVSESWVLRVAEKLDITLLDTQSPNSSVKALPSIPPVDHRKLPQERNGLPKSAPAPPVLEGVVLVFSSTVSHIVSEIGNKAQKMGARCLTNFDTSKVTHFVHHGSRENSKSKEFTLATQNNIKIVSPAWIYDCYDKRTRLCESQYPYTFGSKHCIPTDRSGLVTPSKKYRQNGQTLPAAKPNPETIDNPNLNTNGIDSNPHGDEGVEMERNIEDEMGQAPCVTEEVDPEPPQDKEFQIISNKIDQLIKAAMANPVEQFSHTRKRKHPHPTDRNGSHPEGVPEMDLLPPPPTTYEIPEVHVPYERDIPAQGFAIINREEVALRRQLAQGVYRSKRSFSLKGSRSTKTPSGSSRSRP